MSQESLIAFFLQLLSLTSHIISCFIFFLFHICRSGFYSFFIHIWNLADLLFFIRSFRKMQDESTRKWNVMGWLMGEVTQVSVFKYRGFDMFIVIWGLCYMVVIYIMCVKVLKVL